jgi:hypothetical protein
LHNRCKEQRFYYRKKRKKIYMDNQKMNTERLIASFANTSSNWVSVFKSEDDEYWDHYFSLTGRLNNKYFHVRINNYILDNVDKVEVSSNTDCKEEIEALLIKFNLV